MRSSLRPVSTRPGRAIASPAMVSPLALVASTAVRAILTARARARPGD